MHRKRRSDRSFWDWVDIAVVVVEVGMSWTGLVVVEDDGKGLALVENVVDLKAHKSCLGLNVGHSLYPH